MKEKKDTYKYENQEEYLKALDTIIPKLDKYIKKKDIPSGSHKYYPIEVKRAIADGVFKYWNVTAEYYENFYNEILCTVKITYLPSYTGADELFCTGTGLKEIQMDKGSKFKDFPANKKLNALGYNVPSARSSAIGNALATLGNVFGRNLNSKFGAGFTLKDYTEHKPEDDKPEDKKPEDKKPEDNKPETEVKKPVIDAPF